MVAIKLFVLQFTDKRNHRHRVVFEY